MRKLGFWLVLKIKVKLCKNQDYSFSEDHDRTFLDQWRFLRLRGFFNIWGTFLIIPSFSHPHFLFSRCSFFLLILAKFSRLRI